MSQNLYALINPVLERFDFAKVHRVMMFLDWKWAQWPGPDRVPSVVELSAAAYEQLSRAIDLFEKHGRPQTGMNVASGGFQANVCVYQSGSIELELLFYVDHVNESLQNYD